MSNLFFNASGAPGQKTKGASAAIRAEFAAIAAGFDLFPASITPGGYLRGNPGGTGFVFDSAQFLHESDADLFVAANGDTVTGRLDFTATESIRLKAANALLTGYDVTGNTRTGFILFNAGGQLVFGSENGTTQRWDVAGLTRMALDLQGNLTLGNVNPQAKLHVYGGNAATAVLAQSNIASDAGFRSKTLSGDWIAGTSIGAAANTWGVYDIGVGALRFTIDNTGSAAHRAANSVALALINTTLTNANATGSTAMYFGDATSGTYMVEATKRAVNARSLCINSEYGYNTPVRTAEFYTQGIDLFINGAVAFRLGANGYTGIGPNVNPVVPLDLISPGSVAIGGSWSQLASFRESNSGSNRGISLGFSPVEQVGIVGAQTSNPAAPSALALWTYFNGWAERWRIDVDGRVKTSTPEYRINYDGGYVSGFSSGGATRYGYMQFNPSNMTLAVENGGSMLFIVASAVRLAINSAGKIVDGSGLELGWRGLPAAGITSGNLSANDAGKVVWMTNNINVPAGTFAGTEVIVLQNTVGGPLTITSDISMVWGSASGTRIIAAGGRASIIFRSGSLCYIEGALS